MLKFCKLFTLIFFLSSCSIITFEELRINSNITENTVYFNSEQAQIDFSIPVLFTDITEILTLKKDSRSINYKGNFEKQQFYFYPEEGWQNNQLYTIIINTELKTSKGKFNVNFQRDFIYGKENDLFLLTESSLPDCINENSIILKFNKPLNLNSFENAFSIQPYINLIKKYDDNDRKIILTPKDNWPANTWFTISIRDLNSKDGYFLQTEVNEFFLPHRDIILPQLLTAFSSPSQELSDENPNYINCNTSFSFQFNKEVNLSNFKNYFSISPTINGDFYQNENIITFIPSHPLSPATEYTLTIPQKITDTNEIKFSKDYVFKLITQNEFLYIEDISINQTANLPFYSTISDIPEPTQITLSTDRLFVKITFSDELKPNQQNSLEKYFSVTPYFPSDIKTPKLISITHLKESKSVILEYENFTSSSESPALYKLQITGDRNGILDINNFYLENNACIIFSLN